jgi:hypothetical protein
MINQEQFERNQKMLAAARREVLEHGGLSNILLQYRLNPSDPAFPLAYSRLDPITLKRVTTALGEVYATPPSSQCYVL